MLKNELKDYLSRKSRKMGVAITELLVMKDIDIASLRGKTLVVDAPMWLYQFLSSIRQRDGSY